MDQEIHFTIQLRDGDVTEHHGVLADLQGLLDHQNTKSVEYKLNGELIKTEN